VTQLYSLQFLAFLVCSLVAYYAVGRALGRGQWVVLLVASLVFYAASGWQHLAFVLVTALSVWWLGRKFFSLEEASKEERRALKDRAQKKEVKARYNRRKWHWLLAGLVLNLGILSYIKYWNAVLGLFGANDGPLASRFLLPLGISFYTFQSLGYLIDTYNGKYEPEQNPARFLLFVSYFPQLIQGPINRWDALAGQLFEHHTLDLDDFRRGVVLFLYGMLKKFVMADLLVGVIGACLNSVTTGTPGSVVVFGILLYSAQQYGDFSGGIDMVMGVSRLFGIKMAPNFRQPYFATSLADFWRRWHITLGAWMRDYVFYPFALRPSMKRLGAWANEHLGRHLGRTLPACAANLLVFFLVGLWHGAQAHYIWWGVYNGVVIALADLCAPAFARMREATGIERHPALHRLLAIVRTFVVVNIGWYFDRIETFQGAVQGFANTLAFFRFDLFLPYLRAYPTTNLTFKLALACVAILIVFVVSVLRERGVDVCGWLLRRNVAVRAAAYFAIIMLVLFSALLLPSGGDFIYANF